MEPNVKFKPGSTWGDYTFTYEHPLFGSIPSELTESIRREDLKIIQSEIEQRSPGELMKRAKGLPPGKEFVRRVECYRVSIGAFDQKLGSQIQSDIEAATHSSGNFVKSILHTMLRNDLNPMKHYYLRDLRTSELFLHLFRLGLLVRLYGLWRMWGFDSLQSYEQISRETYDSLLRANSTLVYGLT